MEIRAESRGYLLEDYRLFHLSDAQGTKIDYHYHEFCKLLFLRSGSGWYVVEGRRYFLEAGDIVLLPSHCVHRPDFESGMPYERTIVYVDPEFLSHNSTSDCDLQQILSGEWGNVLRPDAHNRKQLFSMVDHLEQVLAAKGYGQEIISNTVLLQLFVALGKVLQNPRAVHPTPIEPTSERILKIQRYIDAHLEEDISIDLLAEQFYISKYHMMRQFRSETGMSIHSYLLERRLFLARERINQGVQATDSCFRSGFRSYSSFTRAYAKYFGTTPTGRADRTVLREETYE